MSKKAKVPVLIKRSRAIEKTRRKFEGKPFVLGKSDCLQMVRYHLVQMGHRNLPVPPKYTTALGAMKALKAQGAEDLEQLMDKHLESMPPAQMYPGDICLLPAEVGDEDDGFGQALAVSLGQKVWGWHPDAEGMTVLAIDPSAISKAWRA